MATFNRRYTEVPVNVRPDVPHYVNNALGEIDRDVELVSLRTAAARLHSEGVQANLTELSTRVPVDGTVPGYEEVALNAQDQLARGLMTDGTNHLPRILADRIELDGGAWMETADLPGYLRVSVNAAGQMAEDAIAADGTKPDWVLRRQAKRTPGAGLGPLHLLVVAGQSNATKLEAATEAATGTAYDDARVLRWNHGAGAIVTETGTNWLGSGFARQWVKDNPGKRVLVVMAATGSTGFWSTSLNPRPAGYNAGSGTWDRTLTADPQNFPVTYLRDRVAAAAAAAKELTGAEPPKIAMLWCQGENDTGHPAAEYRDKLDDLFEYARELWGTPQLPIIVASMTPAGIRRSAGHTAIDGVHLDTPRRLPLTAYHRGPEGYEENTAYRTHYVPLGQELRGADIAARILPRALRNNTAADPVRAVLPPGAVIITRSGSTARISWEHPACRMSGITLDTSTDEGGTWTAQTLTGPVAIEHTLTVPAAAPLWVRLATVNGTNTSYYREARA